MNTANNSATVNDELAQLILSPRAYAELEELDRGFRWLRTHNPVGRVEAEGYDPFWAITKHKDIVEISRRNDLFNNSEGGLVLRPRAYEDMIRSMRNGSPHMSPTMINMDGPEHAKYRRILQGPFMPQKLQALERRIRDIARASVDHMAALGGECDFARDVALRYPLRVVMEIVGFPAEDEALILKLTRETLGSEDEDLRRDARSAGTPADQMSQRLDVLGDLRTYFADLTDSRRKHPRDDIATVIANAEIDGAPIGHVDAMRHYILMVLAGHETTSSSTSGAIWALCERPDEFRKVKADRTLVPNLVEEAVRYTSPAGHFMRTASADTILRDRVIAKGDRLMLCYKSGNRDEDVFEDPDEFRVERDPTRHRAFGNGAHVCLGQHLARLEMRIFFEELLARLDHVELAGQPARAASTFVSGPKSVPVRYRIN